MNTTISELGLQPQFVIIPIIFAGLSLIAILIGVLAAAVRSFSRGEGFLGGAALIVAGLAACIGIAWIFIPIPYNAKYWPIYSVSGTIQSVSNGFADGSGDSTVRVYVVKFDGDQRPYQLTDARVSTLKGQKVALACTINWNNFGYEADSWDCAIRSAGYTTEGTVTR